MARLAGKTVLISGGATGLGAACAHAMAKEGASIIVADRDTDSGRALCAGLGSTARFMEHDALSEQNWIELIKSIESREGRLDALLNCVGGILIDPIDVATFGNWRLALSLNLDTVFLGCHYAIPLMRNHGSGSIINFGSTMGLRARGESVAYSTAKAGIIMMTRSIAIRCGEAGYGIRCNSISPGTVLTAMTEATLAGLVENNIADTREDAIAMITALRPLRRLGEPSEVANTAVFLASDESSYITGVDIPVDGGYSAA
jgi:3(or 17)beta-hydroxysteroid dehydrogenase